VLHDAKSAVNAELGSYFSQRGWGAVAFNVAGYNVQNLLLTRGKLLHGDFS
jgi:hypothetical protein